MNDGIEKLQKYAFGMKPRRCDDILVLADQIQREHVSELQTLEKRYKTDLRDAREARDIAIKEASKLRNDKRLMPEVLGADGLPIEVGDTVYFVSGSEPYRVESLHQRKDGMFAVCGIESQPAKPYIYCPGSLTHTQPDTQERINEDVCKVADACTYFSSDGSCAKCKLVSQYGDADSAYEACPKSVELEQLAILYLLRRQRELDARTMGGE